MYHLLNDGKRIDSATFKGIQTKGGVQLALTHKEKMRITQQEYEDFKREYGYREHYSIVITNNSEAILLDTLSNGLGKQVVASKVSTESEDLYFMFG